MWRMIYSVMFLSWLVGAVYYYRRGGGVYMPCHMRATVQYLKFYTIRPICVECRHDQFQCVMYLLLLVRCTARCYDQWVCTFNIAIAVFILE